MKKKVLLLALTLTLLLLHGSHYYFAQARSPIRLIPNLQSITFWERTGGIKPDARTFSANDARLSTRLSDKLLVSRPDFGTRADEFYDVFYSNADGSINIDGEYITIECVFFAGLPKGGGLNIAEVTLNYENKPIEYAKVVASFVVLGDNALRKSVRKATDGKLQTASTLGNTSGQSRRLRLTLGFLSSSGLRTRK